MSGVSLATVVAGASVVAACLPENDAVPPFSCVAAVVFSPVVFALVAPGVPTAATSDASAATAGPVATDGCAAAGSIAGAWGCSFAGASRVAAFGVALGLSCAGAAVSDAVVSDALPPLRPRAHEMPFSGET